MSQARLDLKFGKENSFINIMLNANHKFWNVEYEYGIRDY